MCFGAEPEENLTGALELSPADRDLKSRFEELLSSGAPASSVRTYQQPIDVQDVLHASEGGLLCLFLFLCPSHFFRRKVNEYECTI